MKYEIGDLDSKPVTGICRIEDILYLTPQDEKNDKLYYLMKPIEDEKDKIKKFERWNKISVEASKQCGRSDIVEVMGVCNFNEMLDKLNDFDIVIIAYENETRKLKEVIKEKYKAKNIAVIIGAEGGFDKCEVEKVLEKSNASSVSLGDRILRAETASLNLISILMYEFEM